ncbi:PTS ascorbate transporter subunit IIC [Candidatus Clostridium radicumherbarum]|uniref:Ascorbate-specific PTS system EIIC component n=1 Tax=Candidatus Clostridium radicumherbarum TaxID=3381662 RepID=A0ABW8TQD6_9CLOT
MKVVISLLSNAGILVGLISMIGLILQKKSADDVLKGTFKTIIGFLIFNIGSSAISAVLTNFNTLFQKGFGITGVVTQVEAATALAQGKFGTIVAIVMIVGFAANLLFARITPFKNIFLTGQHSLYFACVLTLVLKACNIGNTATAIIGGLFVGLSAAALPAITQPYMRKITGSNDLALGHYNEIAYAFSGFLGSKVGNPEHSTENFKFPKWLSIFRDFTMCVAVVMVIVFYVAAIAAGQADTQKLAGTVNWIVFPLLQGLQFAAGMSVLITGVRMFISEITAAFVSISEKYIPNSRPAVDCPSVFPFAPTAVILGFISAYVAGLVAMAGMIIFKSSIVMIPSASIAFFSGGTAGVFGNSTGGWKGCIAGSFVLGILVVTLPMLLYPVFAHLGIVGASFPNVDYNIVGTLLYKITQFIQSVIH